MVTDIHAAENPKNPKRRQTTALQKLLDLMLSSVIVDVVLPACAPSRPPA
jgi:hypothetical protein